MRYWVQPCIVLQAQLRGRLTDGSFVSDWLPVAKPYVNFAAYGARVAAVGAASSACFANCALPPPSPPPAASPPPFPPAPPRPPRATLVLGQIIWSINLCNFLGL